jgi:branched-chain amino acid transport system substrate-binding protein
MESGRTKGGESILRASRKLMKLLALSAVFAVVAAACGGDDGGEDGEEPGGDQKETVKIAFFGATTGELSALVVPGLQGARLRFQQAVAADEIPVNVEVVDFDTQADPAVAAPLVEEVVNDEEFVGVIGPAFSGESAGVGDRLEEAGIPRITQSATDDALALNGWTGWFRALGNNSDMGLPAGRYIAAQEPNSACAASDGSAYGLGLKDIVVETLEGDGIEVPLNEDVEPGLDDYSALVTGIQDAGCEILFYGGYSPEAGLIRDQMTDAGLGDVTMVGGDGIKDSVFLDTAGDSAEGVIVSCPCADLSASDDEAAVAFNEAYEAEFGEPPAIYAAEGYDVASIYVEAFKTDATDRAGIIEFVQNLEGFQGLTKSFTWEDNGELTTEGKVIYFYEVQGGEFVVQGTEEEVIG